MQITVGLEYRWGDGEDQGLKVKGGQDVQPSYPELIGWTGQRIDPEKPLGVPVLISQQTYLKKRNNLNNLSDQENAIPRELTLTWPLVKLSQHSEAVAFVFKEGQDLVEGFGIGF